MILSKYENEKYALSYAKINFAQRVGFDRPIKLVFLHTTKIIGFEVI